MVIRPAGTRLANVAMAVRHGDRRGLRQNRFLRLRRGTVSYSGQRVFADVAGPEAPMPGYRTGFAVLPAANLWSGREQDRASLPANSATPIRRHRPARWGGSYASRGENSRHHRRAMDGRQHPKRYVVATGGEPLCRSITPLHRRAACAGFETAIETNGTRIKPEGIDWVWRQPEGRIRSRGCTRAMS